MRHCFRLVLASLALLAAGPAVAQGRWLDTFAVPGAFEGSFINGAAVNAIAPDGAGALVAGDFALVDDVRAVGVARWTGAVWEAFGGGLRRTPDPNGPNPSTRGVAHAVVRATDGAVWVAGSFDAVVQPDGTELAAAGLARWEGGAWSVPGRLTGGTSGPPAGYALLVQGASVVVGGDFADLIRPDGTAIGGGNVARWTAGAWEPLAQDDGPVFALATLPGGRVLAPGRVETPDGNGATAVEAWDGAAWQPFTGPLAGFFTPVRALHADGDNLYVGGQFEGGLTPDGELVASSDVIRWDGAAWQPLGRGVTGEVNALATDAAGGLLVGGRLGGGLDPDGTPVGSPGLVRWTGTAWERRALSERRGLVLALARSGAEMLAGGQFDAVGGTGDATRRAVNVAALPAGGGLRPLSSRTGRDGTFPYDGTGIVNHLATDGCGGVHVFADGKVGPLPSGVVRTWDGEAWEPVPDGIRTAAILTAFPGSPGITYSANDLAAVPGSCDAFVLAGQFGGISANGTLVESRNVVLWTGQAWQPLGRGTDGFVAAVTVGADGAVTVGGRFSTVFQAGGASLTARNVARWTEAGGWQALGGGVRPEVSVFPGGVYELLAETGGAVVVGGRFASVVDADGTEQTVRNLSRWTGARWEAFGGPTSTQNVPVAISALVQWQGNLVATGNFVEVAQPGGAITDARGIAAWDGAAWRALPGLTTNVAALAVVDGMLVAAGGLDFRPARWTGSAWVPLGEDAPANVSDLAAVGRRLYASGGVETAGGIGSPGLAVFDFDAASPAETPPTETASGALHAYPNPSRASATLAFRLDAAGPVRLALVDALGRTVAVLHDGELAAGEQTVRVDTSRLPAGVYVARLDAGGRVEARRITVVR